LYAVGLLTAKEQHLQANSCIEGLADTYLDLRAVSSPRQFDSPGGAIRSMSTDNSTSDRFGMGAATKSRNITQL
jgi:hypothetical protein